MGGDGIEAPGATDDDMRGAEARDDAAKQVEPRVGEDLRDMEPRDVDMGDRKLDTGNEIK